MSNRKHQEYLGDGVYAFFDGYHIVLYTSDGVQESNHIYLDSHVVRSLINYIKIVNGG